MTDNFMDRLEDELEDMPEGEHDDATDAIKFDDDWIKTPMRLRRGFNVLMVIVNIFATSFALLVVPILVGLFVFDPPVTFWDWLQTYAVGLIIAGAGIAGALYFGTIWNMTVKAIRRNINLIRKNLR
jgi:hypothetical protein